jgi:hypothetical protein
MSNGWVPTNLSSGWAGVKRCLRLINGVKHSMTAFIINNNSHIPADQPMSPRNSIPMLPRRYHDPLPATAGVISVLDSEKSCVRWSEKGVWRCVVRGFFPCRTTLPAVVKQSRVRMLWRLPGVALYVLPQARLAWWWWSPSGSNFTLLVTRTTSCSCD